MARKCRSKEGLAIRILAAVAVVVLSLACSPNQVAGGATADAGKADVTAVPDLDAFETKLAADADVAAVDDIDDLPDGDLQDVAVEMDVDAGFDAVSDVQVAVDASDLPADATFGAFSWKKMAKMKVGRVRPKVAWGDNRLYVWGGKSKLNPGQDSTTLPPKTDGFENSIERYDPKTDTWESLPMPPTYPDSSGRIVWGGDRLYVYNRTPWWSGPTPWVTTPLDAAAYFPKENIWKPLPELGAPQAFGAAAVAWIGGRLFVWGGASTPSAVAAPGASYDPSSDSWLPLPEAPTITNEHDGAYNVTSRQDTVTIRTKHCGLDFSGTTNKWIVFPYSPQAMAQTDLTLVEFSTSTILGELIWADMAIKPSLWMREYGTSVYTTVGQPPGNAKITKFFLVSNLQFACLGFFTDLVASHSGACQSLATGNWALLSNPDPEYKRADFGVGHSNDKIFFVGGEGASEKFFGSYWLYADGWILDTSKGEMP